MPNVRTSEQTMDFIEDARRVLLKRARERGDKTAELAIPDLTNDEVIQLALLEMIAKPPASKKSEIQKLYEKLDEMARQVAALK